MKEALKLALEALEGAEALLLSMGLTHLNVYGDAEKAINAIREALASPVATNDTSQECVDETSKQRHEAQPDQESVCEHGIGKTKCSFCHQPQPEQESVAWVCYGWASDEKHAIDYEQHEIDAIPVGTLLYTSPPHCKPLSDDEIAKIAEKYTEPLLFRVKDFARAIEQAHGIKE